MHGVDHTLAVGARVGLDPADTPRTPQVRAHPAVAGLLNRGHGSVLLDAHLEVLNGVPTSVRAQPVVLAGQLQQHRSVRLLRQGRRDQVEVIAAVLVAETAAHVLADDLDLVVFETQIPRVVMAAVGDALGRRVNRDLVPVPLGQSRAGLHLGVLNEGRRISILEHAIRCPEPRSDVAHAPCHRSGFVAKVQAEIALGPDLGSPSLQCFFQIDHEWQLLPIDVDERQRFFGHVAIDRGYRGHRLADVAHRVVEHVADVLGDVLGSIAVLPAPGDRARAVDVLVGLVSHDGAHARKRLGSGDVDATDARVRMRTPQDTRIQHAGDSDVARIRGLSGDALIRVDARHVVPDRVQGTDGSLRFLRGHGAPPVRAVTRTASTIAL